MFGIIETMIFGWMFLFSAGFGIPSGMVPGEEDPYLYKIAPAECYMYASWSGTKMPDPESNPSEKWMAQDEIQGLVQKAKSELLLLSKKLKKSDKPGNHLEAFLVKLPGLIATRPCAFYIDRAKWNKDAFLTADLAGAFVVNLGDRADEISKDLNGLKLDNLGLKKRSDGLIELVTGEFIDDFNCEFAIENGYLILAFAQGELVPSVGTVRDNGNTPEPRWLVEIKDELTVEKRASVSMLNITMFEQLSENNDLTQHLNELSNGDVDFVGWVTGLNRHGYVARTTIRAVPEPQGILNVFHGDPIDRKMFESIPADSVVATATRFSVSEIYKLIERMVDEAGELNDFQEMIADFEAFSGVTLKDDLLAKLDNYVFFYGDPQLFDPYKGWAVGIGIKDEMGFLDTLAGFNRRIADQLEESADAEFKQEIVEGVEVYSVHFFRNNFMPFQQIVWCHFGQQLVLSFDEETLANHLRRDGDRLVDSGQLDLIYEFANEIGVEGPIAFFYLDFAGILQLLQPFWHFLDNMQEPIINDTNLTLADLPGFDSMVNGLSPHITGFYKTERGYQLYQQQVFPGGSPPATIALSMVAFLTLGNW